MKILITDKLATEGVEKLKNAGFEVEEDLETKGAELAKKMSEEKFDALIVRSGTKVTKEIIDAAQGLKVIGRAGAGLDNIDLEAAKARGITVLNSPGGNTISAAEHTMAMMLALCRNIPQCYEGLAKREWNRKKYKGVELYHKTLGIIGLGRIGQEVAKRAKAFEMRVIASDPFALSEVFKELGVEKVEPETLFKESDFVTVHVPKNEKTTNLIGKKEFEQMKEGVRIINVARGGIINEKALLEALQSGKVAGAALDVYEKEPPEFWDLLKLENVVHTSHLGALTKEAQTRCGTEIADKVIAELGKQDS